MCRSIELKTVPPVKQRPINANALWSKAIVGDESGIQNMSAERQYQAHKDKKCHSELLT